MSDRMSTFGCVPEREPVAFRKLPNVWNDQPCGPGCTTPEEFDESRNPKDIAGSLKPDLSLIPPSAQIVESLALAYGAAEYGRLNWRKERIRITRYIAAMLRHIAAFNDGEDFDPKSGVSHLGHIRATAGIMIDALSLNCAIDDRGTEGRASELLTQYTRKDTNVATKAASAATAAASP